MKRLLALFLVLLLTVGYLAVPVAAFAGGGIEVGSNGGGSESGNGSGGTMVGTGSPKEFGMATEAEEETSEPTWGAVEAEPDRVFSAETEAAPVIETLFMEEPVQATEPAAEVPIAPVAQQDTDLVQELRDAVSAMKLQMMVILALALVICLLLLAFLILYARGILVIRKPAEGKTRRVTMEEKWEKPPVTEKRSSQADPAVKLDNQQPYAGAQNSWNMPTVKLPETEQEEELPPIGQTVILRKPSEQINAVEWTRKE